MKEIWRTIKEFPNYQVSNLGRIKRIEHYTEMTHNRYKNITIKCYYPERIKSNNYKSGKCRRYNYVNLKGPNGNKRKVRVHRLVAEYFVDNPRGLSEVDHIDRNPDNNRADNLRWCTRSENIKNRNKYEHTEEFYRNHPNYKRKD